MSSADCRAIREALKMTQDEFARAIGLKSWLTVLRWESGAVRIYPDRAFAILALAKENNVRVPKSAMVK